MHQQRTSRIGVGLFRCDIEIVDQINDVLVQWLSCYPSIEERVLRVKAPLRPARAVGARYCRLRRGVHRQKSAHARNDAQTNKGLASIQNWIHFEPPRFWNDLNLTR